MSARSGRHHAAHLVRRFLGSLSRRPPPVADEAWATGWLLPGERAVWRRLSAPDRRHAIAVARRVRADLGPAAAREVMAAALLHDCGKLDSGLGTFGRVAVTVWATVRGPARVAAGRGRAARYLHHADLGAERLRRAGSAELTVAWTAQHHWPPHRWTVPHDLAHALKDADDD